MYSFKNDYSEGAHPLILEALLKHNLTQEEGYGLDSHTEQAKLKLQELMGNSSCDIHLISGGTQTNLIAISAFLRPHEACISPTSGHIATYETGAIEATGHKVLTTDTENGKLTPQLVDKILIQHHFEHMVKPRLVYISNPTEFGTVYTKEELQKLYDFCQEKDLLLYCDGARLGAALTIQNADLTLEDMTQLTDAFFIGGTKTGALLGEALVITKDSLKQDMRYLIKQRGALLAKGRVLGIQFETLFDSDLYFQLARHGNEMASLITNALKDLGCKFLIESPTNQIFPIMKNTVIDKLLEHFHFYTWEKIDEEYSAVRLITSWATKEENINQFIEMYKKVSGNA